MSALSFIDTLSDARAQWLEGDTQAWARYTECCLQLEAELRKAQRAPAPLQPTPSSVSSSGGPEQPEDEEPT